MPPAPVAQVLPLAGRLTKAVQLSLVLPEARHQPAAGATAATRLVGLRRSLVSVHLLGWSRYPRHARNPPDRLTASGTPEPITIVSVECMRAHTRRAQAG